jgi:hypothetical protein
MIVFRYCTTKTDNQEKSCEIFQFWFGPYCLSIGSIWFQLLLEIGGTFKPMPLKRRSSSYGGVTFSHAAKPFNFVVCAQIVIL